MTLVVDASVVVAALVDDAADGEWARELLATAPLAAPHLMPIEVANVLRRAALSGTVSDADAELAHHDLVELRVRLSPYAALLPRAWALRGNLTVYDACYVALAESLDAPLATLDGRLARAPGMRCTFLTRKR